MNNAAVAISSALVGVALNVLPAQAVTFKDVTQGILTFEGTGYYSSSVPERPITGQGTFKYSAEPIDGIFVLLGNGETRFFDNPNDIPISPESSPRASLSINASQNLRIVTEVDISLETQFSYRNRELSSGDFFSLGTLLFEPPGSSSFPPGSGGLYIMTPIASRYSPDNISLGDGWFLGDPFGLSNGQLSLSNDGGFVGFALDLPEPVNFGGTWAAEAIDSSQPPTVSVPEPQPLAMLGASAALGLAALGKRKLSKNKY